MIPEQKPSGSSPPPPNGPGRLLGAVFGIVFAGIGLAVIISLWSVRGFGEPPMFFKLVGSFIAIAFVAFGAAFASAAFKRQPLPGQTHDAPPSGAGPADEAGYKCPACGARLGDGADVSPRGDVKCGYCKQWFNIHA
jgi:hypothetical protein